MKINNFLYILIICCFSSFFMLSCNDEYEREPVENFTLEYVFSKSDSMGVQSRQFLNNIYSLLQNGHNRVGSDYLDAASDDAISIKEGNPDVYKLALGIYTSTTRVTSDMKWEDYFKGIRQVNIFINNIDVVPFKTKYTNYKKEVKPLNTALKCEARFLRAHFYFELVKRYGGVPLMGDVIHKLGDDMELPRNTFEDCINYIVKELDDIKEEMRTVPIPDETEWGHVPTYETCLAMKSRVLLYAASPLFNQSPIEKGNELVGYKNYDANRWNLAAQSAKEFIDNFGPEGKNIFSLTKNFKSTFLNFYNISVNPELIWFVQGGKGRSIETANGPLGFAGDALGNGRTLPTQNLVDEFPMIDGKKIGESTKYVYQPNDPYANRDPRLDATVLHNNSKWLNKNLEIFMGGANNPSSAEYCKTGYYLRKFMGSYETTSVYGSELHLWIMYRYAEILLNYAEAENEYLDSPSDDIYKSIIQIRQRAGIESGDDQLYGLKANMSKDEMREVIRSERRIEMAFEEQRYWDIRRWKIAQEIFESPLKGVRIVSSLGRLSFSRIDVQKNTFETKRYLYPIPYSEVVNNKNMIQNPNW